MGLRKDKRRLIFFTFAQPLSPNRLREGGFCMAPLCLETLDAFNWLAAAYRVRVKRAPRRTLAI